MFVCVFVFVCVCACAFGCLLVLYGFRFIANATEQGVRENDVAAHGQPRPGPARRRAGAGRPRPGRAPGEVRRVPGRL